MDRDLLIRHTEQVPAIQPSEEFKAAARAKVLAEEKLERRRKELAPLIASEVARGVKLSHVAKEANYTPEHVRRIARAHEVEATVHREPPPPRRRKPAVE